MFRNRVDANDAIRSLLADGIHWRDVSLLMSDATRVREFSDGGGRAASLDDVHRIAVESVMLNGVGVLASGPIIETFTRHPYAHTLRDALRALELDEAQRTRIADTVQHGGIVLIVDAPFGDETITQANLDVMGDPELELPEAMRAALDAEVEDEYDWTSAAVSAPPAFDAYDAFHRQG